MMQYAYSKEFGYFLGQIQGEIGTDKYRIDRSWFMEQAKGGTNIVLRSEVDVKLESPTESEMQKVRDECISNIAQHKRN